MRALRSTRCRQSSDLKGSQLMAATTGALPRKATGLITRELGDDIVVVDSATDTAHSLSGLTAQVWRSLDVGRLPATASATQVAAALGKLEQLGLLVEKPGFSRRDMLQRAGTVAVGATVLTIGLPTVAMANSNGTTGTT